MSAAAGAMYGEALEGAHDRADGAVTVEQLRRHQLPGATRLQHAGGQAAQAQTADMRPTGLAQVTAAADL